MTVQPNRVWKEAGVQEKVWTEPLLQRIAPTPDLLELFRRIHAGEPPDQLEPLKRKIAAMRKQNARPSLDTRTR